MQGFLNQCSVWFLSIGMLDGRRRNDEAGASLVEYALLVALIAVVCIGAVSFLGAGSAAKFSSVGTSLQ